MATQKSDKDILAAFGRALLDDIRRNAEAQDRNATGRASDSLREEATDSTLLLIDGAGYTEWGWEYGRGPGKMTPVAKLIKWINDRAITPRIGSVKSMAWATALKHAAEGSVQFRRGRPSGVITKVISERAITERLQPLTQTLTRKYVQRIQSDVVRSMLRVNKSVNM